MYFEVTLDKFRLGTCKISGTVKVNDVIVAESEMNTQSSQNMSEQIISTQETEVESIVDNTEANDHEKSFAEEVLNDVSTTNEATSTEIEQT